MITTQLCLSARQHRFFTQWLCIWALNLGGSESCCERAKKISSTFVFSHFVESLVWGTTSSTSACGRHMWAAPLLRSSESFSLGRCVPLLLVLIRSHRDLTAEEQSDDILASLESWAITAERSFGRPASRLPTHLFSFGDGFEAQVRHFDSPFTDRLSVGSHLCSKETSSTAEIPGLSVRRWQ